MLEISEHWQRDARGTWRAMCVRCNSCLLTPVLHSPSINAQIVRQLAICPVCGLRNVLTFKVADELDQASGA